MTAPERDESARKAQCPDGVADLPELSGLVQESPSGLVRATCLTIPDGPTAWRDRAWSVRAFFYLLGLLLILWVLRVVSDVMMLVKGWWR
jgi:hypothetical protein